jgi:hypothetical protein
MDLVPYCDHKQSDEYGALICDRPKGHTGRHRERWVASWNDDGTDVKPPEVAGPPISSGSES